MTEDRFDELIRSAARDYNRPGEVPRERMWERVQATRAAEGAGTRRGTPRTRRRVTWLWGALAAAAVLTIGIGIGRWMERTSPGRAGVVATNGGTDRGTTAGGRGGAVTDGVPDSADRATGSADRTPVTAIRPERTAGRLADRAADHPADRDGRSTGGGAAASSAKRFAVASPRGGRQSMDAASTGGDEPAMDASALAYRAVVLQHLAGTEAMLTSFRDATRSASAHVDPQLASWARDQLATTRMLQASARSDDPTMKRLLDDLELVLMQIAQYTAGDRHRAEDARLIEQAIERKSVITRLRTIPAGIVSPGT